MDGCEILHQFLGGLSHYKNRISTIQGGAGFLPSTVWHDIFASFLVDRIRKKPSKLLGDLPAFWRRWDSPRPGRPRCRGRQGLLQALSFGIRGIRGSHWQLVALKIPWKRWGLRWFNAENHRKPMDFMGICSCHDFGISEGSSELLGFNGLFHEIDPLVINSTYCGWKKSESPVGNYEVTMKHCK